MAVEGNPWHVPPWSGGVRRTAPGSVKQASITGPAGGVAELVQRGEFDSHTVEAFARQRGG